MKNVAIELGKRSYTIHIDSGISSARDALQNCLNSTQNSRQNSAQNGNQVFILSNEIVAPLYLPRLKKNLNNKEVHQLILPDGETVKNLHTLTEVLNAMVKARLERSATVIALGGGVIGDIAGFAASCYQRGVPFIQIPTTLLAQVDSSVGGKTGVNHPQGKNLIGAFYQPKGVLIDPDVLKTLEPRQFSAGLAEVIKYGLIGDADFLAWLEDNLEAIKAQESVALEYMIAQSCLCKARIVQQDEHERGVRALLNLGHTFGHAIETATHYSSWLHGEAVALGMLMAAEMSAKMGLITEREVARLSTLLNRAGLTTERQHGLCAEQILHLMSMDKKVKDGKIRLVLLKQLGEAFITSDYDNDILRQTVQQYALGDES